MRLLFQPHWVTHGEIPYIWFYSGAGHLDSPTFWDFVGDLLGSGLFCIWSLGDSVNRDSLLRAIRMKKHDQTHCNGNVKNARSHTLSKQGHGQSHVMKVEVNMYSIYRCWSRTMRVKNLLLGPYSNSKDGGYQRPGRRLENCPEQARFSRRESTEWKVGNNGITEPSKRNL